MDSKAYIEAYKRLNEQQKHAVDDIDGPMLVIAGPGTGKTQLLSLRVANILKTTDTYPSNILCLTFTNYAANNLRERLANLIGPASFNVKVHTFHAYAAEIMNNYPDYFWNGARLTVVPDALQLSIIESILSKLPLDNPLASRFAGQYSALSDVVSALRLTKDAGLTADKLSAMIAVNKAYIEEIESALVEIMEPKLSFKKLDDLSRAINKLPDQAIDESIRPLVSLSNVLKQSLARAIDLDKEQDKTTNTSKWKASWLQSISGQKGLFNEKKRNDWWQALASVYKEYRQELHKSGYYDYSDMLVEVISQIENNPSLLSELQENNHYILIDEFQDSNNAQLRLAHLLASSAVSEGNPNLMAVGDDDQTIYAFNGAELNNMLNFKRTYPDTKIVVLTKNYRSNQAILDVAHSIIEQADNRLVKDSPELDKNLEATQVSLKSQTRIERRAYPTQEHQLFYIAEDIKRIYTEDPLSSIAVLAYSHSSLERISSYLNKRQVPIRYERQNNILSLDIVEQINALSEIISAINKGAREELNFHLSRLLIHPAWQIKPTQLWALAINNRGHEADWLTNLTKQRDEHLNNIANWLMWLSQQSIKEPLGVMMEYLIGLRASQYLTSPLHEYYLNNKKLDSRYLENISGINKLLQLVYEFSETNLYNARLSDFSTFMRLNLDLSRSISDDSWFISGQQAVSLLTIHKAKGLEFDNVFLVDAIDKEWRPRHFGRKPPANLPMQPYGEYYDDYVRLAYVAASRAKHSLIVSSYTSNSSSQLLLASPLFLALPESQPKTNNKDDVDILETALSWPEIYSDNMRSLLEPIVEDYSLSATGLIHYLDVSRGGPKRFIESDLLRLPEPTTPSMIYGTAMHRALQLAQTLVNEDKLDLDKVVAEYSLALSDHRISKNDFSRYKKHGIDTLNSLFKEKGFKLSKGAKAELSISLRLDNLNIKGKLDHVEASNNEVIITDYKTGSALTSFSLGGQAKALKAWSHYTQLLFYVLLIKRSNLYPKAKRFSARVVYLEAESSDELSLLLEPSEEELQRAEKLIRAVYTNIHSFNFVDTSSYSLDIKGVKNFEDDLLK